MKKKYSIVLTVYNSEKYLNHCLDSIYGQTYQNWELILVNDGSTDESTVISQDFCKKIRENNDERTVLYLEHENRGAVFSREKGIANATGDYVLFMDSDDWWDSDLLANINAAVEETGADIVQFGYKFKDESGNNTTDAGLTKKGGTGTGTYEIYTDNNQFAYKALRICYSLWSRAFNRKLFDKKEGFLSDYYDVNMTNDLLALSRPLSLANTYCFTDYYPYNYRIVSSSLCHDISIKKICSYFRSFSWAEKCLFEQNGLSDEHLNFFSERLANIVFDEYRVNIYSAKIRDIKKIYSASDGICNKEVYLSECINASDNWYKKLFLKAFLKKQIIIPKMLYYYSILRNGR